MQKHAWNIGVESDLLVPFKAEFDAIWPLVSLKKRRLPGASAPHLGGLQRPSRAPNGEGPPRDANALRRLRDSRRNHFPDLGKINSIILGFRRLVRVKVIQRLYSLSKIFVFHALGPFLNALVFFVNCFALKIF